MDEFPLIRKLFFDIAPEKIPIFDVAAAKQHVYLPRKKTGQIKYTDRRRDPLWFEDRFRATRQDPETP